MSQKTLQTVIAGAGVSGLYTAWRLIGAGHDPSRLAVFEASDRIGGRLWSMHLHDDSTLPAELGGMFFNDQQSLVFGLCDKVFGLDSETVSPEPDFAWLRATRFPIDKFSDPDTLPYNLDSSEQGLSYYQLLALATDRIAPELKNLWPKNPDRSRDETIAYLRHHEVDGRRLYDWGFWNLLSRVISNEAWQALRDIISSHTMFANWNGYDAMISLVVEQSGKWYRLTRGYQHLPERLAAELEDAGVRVHRHHRLERVARKDDGLTLAIDADGNAHQVDTERLVLALPKHPLAELVVASPDLHDTGLARQLDAVRAIAACKVFLTFDEPWWRNVPDGPGRIKKGTYAVSHTDLPLRQCYYLGKDDARGQGLMLASYADGGAVEYWQALMADSGRVPALHCPLSRLAREDVRRQLSRMHGVDVPAPTDGLFVDWTRPPYGGAWHNWQPGWKSWEMSVTMRRPVADCSLFVCGEAYSGAQGWTEGALESAEAMLEEHFGLERLDWASSAD